MSLIGQRCDAWGIFWILGKIRRSAEVLLNIAFARNSIFIFRSGVRSYINFRLIIWIGDTLCEILVFPYSINIIQRYVMEK